ncbi:MAG: type II toxin-antitoxin system RelE/ParE family toxin [Deltaproteobacteria bacterium]|nr:type II toxin-antitoxin system RelE/ParE family toxin [Deltaproteobacteria bacterium]
MGKDQGGTGAVGRSYHVQFTRKAEQELRELPSQIQKRVGRWVDLLAENPRRTGTRQLEGRPELRRVHVGKDYVIVYMIHEEEILVLVVRVGHRKEVYRRLPD